jgi:PAS domain S-box-containing protein
MGSLRARIFLCMLLLLGTCLYSTTTAPAAEQPNRITVVDDRAYPPFAFLDAAGKPRGITIDIWNLWSRKTGIPVHFRLMDWDDALAEVREGRADAVGGLFRTSEREQDFEFTTKILDIPTAIFFHRRIAGVRDIADIAGFMVGVVRGDSAEELIRVQHPNIRLVAYPGADALIQDAMAGGIKVFVADSPVAQFYLAQNQQAEDFRQSADILINPQFSAVRKGRPALLATVQAGFDRISPSEIAGIVAEWSGRSLAMQIPWRTIALSFAAIVFLAGVVGLWNVQLRRKILAATRDISEKNRQLALSNEMSRQSEHRFRLIFENAPYPVVISRLEDGQVLDVNKAFLRQSGLTRDEVTRLRTSDALIGPSRDNRSVVEALKRNGAVHDQEATTRLPDGSIAHWVYSAVIIDIEARPVVLSMAVNVTETKQAQEALRQSEEKFRTIFNNAPIGILRSSFSGKMVEANTTLARMLGHPGREEFLASVEDLAGIYVDPGDWDRLKDALVASPKGERMEFEFKRNDGTIRYGAVNASLHLDGEGRPSFIDGTVEDITTLKLAVHALKESEERFKSLVQSSPDGIVMLDLNGTILSVNSSLERISGFAREEMVGRNYIDFIGDRHGESLVKGIEAFKSGARRDAPTQVEFRRKDRQVVQLHIIGFMVADEKGRGFAIGAFLRDITQALQLADEKTALDKRLQQAQKMEAIGTLAAGIAHDFNNILSVIIGNADLIAIENCLDAGPLDYLHQIQGASQRARLLVRQILAFSRQENKEKIPLNLSTVAKETVGFLRSSLPANIELHASFSPDIGTVVADPTQMQQVLMNLCSNAAHAMSESGGRLGIQLEPVQLSPEKALAEEVEPGSYVRLRVSDTGHGMDPSICQKIFEPYFTTKETGKGTGLGLAVVHGIVKSHGGFVRVAHTGGEGTAFEVFIPSSNRAVRHAAETGFDLPRGRERVLFVDDEPALTGIGRDFLSRLGYSVEARTSPLEALEAFRATPGKFELVITDMAMPQMNGLDLSREIMRLREGIPIILCTGFSDRNTEDKVRSAGVKALLYKPLLLGDLARIVREVLDAP